jgi:hypothetical protein
MKIDTSWTAVEGALRDLFGAIRQDQCPHGCVQEYAVELACSDHLQAYEVHSQQCPFGRAHLILSAVDHSRMSRKLRALTAAQRGGTLSPCPEASR